MKKILSIPAIMCSIRLYALTLAMFFVYRIILFLTELDKVPDSVTLFEILKVFFIGFRFDSVVVCSILLIPYVFLTVLYFIKALHQLYLHICICFIIIFFTVSFLISSIDIPYFNHFFSRLSFSAFQWLDTPGTVLRMIIGEPEYWLAVIPFLLSLSILYNFKKKLLLSFRNIPDTSEDMLPAGWQIFISAVFLGLLVIGIRGRIEFMSPIRVGTAYFTNNGLLNQLGLNPNYTLLRSMVDSFNAENACYSIMDSQEAIRNVQTYLDIKPLSDEYPILRKTDFGSEPSNPCNVIVIIMESMQAAKLSRHGSRKNLTPFLDKICLEGYYFENAYTAGVSTHHGIFSTLFSFPAIFRRHSMKNVSMLKYQGLATTLVQKGYSAVYFTTHDGQFDNIEGFLKANDFETVVSKKDYPFVKRKTPFGVPDDYMFEFSLPRLNELYSKKSPFLAVYLTTSDHKPYHIPDYFIPKTSKIRDQVVEYADFSLAKFIELCRKEAWFKDTLFVFVADHGLPRGSLYDLSLDYHHTPLLFYAPEIIQKPQVFTNFATQMDIFPTIMGILKIPYLNNTLGTDLLSHKRPWAFFCEYDKYGVINDDWLLVARDNKTVSLYRYRERDAEDYSSQFPDIVREMKCYAESNMQTYLHLAMLKKTFYEDKQPCQP